VNCRDDPKGFNFGAPSTVGKGSSCSKNLQNQSEKRGVKQGVHGRVSNAMASSSNGVPPDLHKRKNPRKKKREGGEKGEGTKEKEFQVGGDTRMERKKFLKRH